MHVDVLIARWVGVFWLVCGLSHLLYPARWGALPLPLRKHESGAFILAGMTLPISLIIVVGHNVWVWDLPVIVTAAGWMATIKSIVYLLYPSSLRLFLRASDGPAQTSVSRGFRIVGVALIALGAITTFDAFFRR